HQAHPPSLHDALPICLSDVYEDNLDRLGPSSRFVDQDHKLVRFYVPPGARWPYLQQQTTGLGELLTDAVRAVSRENPRLHGVIRSEEHTSELQSPCNL